MNRKILNVVTLHRALLVICLLFIQTVNAQVMKNELPKEKQTSLKLYVTAREAYDMWKASQERVKILDVRTNEEYLFIGHAEMAWNVPALLQIYQYDQEKKILPMKVNPEFMERVRGLFKPNDTILVTCRSGGRSAMAVNFLAKEGFRNVFNIIDGMEGDVVDDSSSIFLGQRLKNGWKNSGCPWTYKINPERMLVPKIR